MLRRVNLLAFVAFFAFTAAILLGTLGGDDNSHSSKHRRRLTQGLGTLGGDDNSYSSKHRRRLTCEWVEWKKKNVCTEDDGGSMGNGGSSTSRGSSPWGNHWGGAGSAEASGGSSSHRASATARNTDGTGQSRQGGAHLKRGSRGGTPAASRPSSGVWGGSGGLVESSRGGSSWGAADTLASAAVKSPSATAAAARPTAVGWQDAVASVPAAPRSAAAAAAATPAALAGPQTLSSAAARPSSAFRPVQAAFEGRDRARVRDFLA